MTIIYLIRHADNEFINQGKLAGWLPGIHLTAHGISQAEALAQSLTKVKFKAVYASPLDRAMETAEPIARSKGLEVIPRIGLGETQYGRWQGQSFKVLRRKKLWSIVHHTPTLARFPEGESFTEAQARVVAEIESLRVKHKQPKAIFACVSHADTIKLAIAHYIGLPLDLYNRLTVEPASVSILAIGKSHTRLIRLNDTQAGHFPSGR